MRAFLKEHGNGFWLHGLGAVTIVLVFWFYGWNTWSSTDWAMIGVVVSSVVWFGRECWQHPPIDVFTFHRILEWGTPIITGLLTWSLLP